MKIGIIVAMSKELALLTPLLENKEVSHIDGYEFITGSIGVHEVVAMECGIGKVNAAMGTYTLLSGFDLDLVLSTGVAGGADPDVNVMDVVVADRIAYHDVVRPRDHTRTSCRYARIFLFKQDAIYPSARV